MAQFRQIMDNDLDTPGGTALLFDTVRRANAALDAGSPEAAALTAAVQQMCGAVGLVLNAGGDVPAEAAAKAAALDAARAAKDFATADALRAEPGRRLDRRDHQGRHLHPALAHPSATGPRG